MSTPGGNASGSYSRLNGRSSQGSDPNSKSTNNRSQRQIASHSTGPSSPVLPLTQRWFQPSPFTDQWGTCTPSASSYQSATTFRTGSFSPTPSWLSSESSINSFRARRNTWDGSLASMSMFPQQMGLAELLEHRTMSASEPPRLERPSTPKSSAPTSMGLLSNHFVIQLAQMARQLLHALSLATVETMIKISVVFTVISGLIGTVLSILSFSYLVSFIEDGMEFSQLSGRCVQVLKSIPAGLQRLLIWRINLDPTPTQSPWTLNSSGQPDHHKRRPSSRNEGNNRPQPPVLPPTPSSWTRLAVSDEDSTQARTPAAVAQETYDEPRSIACSSGPMGWALIATGIWLAALLSIALSMIQICASILHTATPTKHEKHSLPAFHRSSQEPDEGLNEPLRDSPSASS